MSKTNYDDESIETDAGFNGGTRTLVSQLQIEAFYDESMNDILDDFAEFNENGSSWIFERVVDLQLNTRGL